MPDRAGHRQEDVGLPLAAYDEKRRERSVRKSCRMVGNDPFDVAERRVVAGGLGDREGRIAPQHLRGPRGHGDAANAEARAEICPGAVVVEEDDASARSHEGRELFDVERSLRMDDDDAVLALEVAERERRVRADGDNALRSELVLRGADEGREAFPVLSVEIERRRESDPRADHPSKDNDDRAECNAERPPKAQAAAARRVAQGRRARAGRRVGKRRRRRKNG